MLNRSTSTNNHCGAHTCSRYYHAITNMKVLYNKSKHKHVKDSDIVTENYIRYTKLKIAKCRMNYGNTRIFDSSR